MSMWTTQDTNNDINNIMKCILVRQYYCVQCENQDSLLHSMTLILIFIRNLVSITCQLHSAIFFFISKCTNDYFKQLIYFEIFWFVIDLKVSKFLQPIIHIQPLKKSRNCSSKLAIDIATLCFYFCISMWKCRWLYKIILKQYYF